MTSAILFFFATIAVTLAITAWAALRSRGAADLYAAGARISGVQNGLAITGDFLSATTLLGITGLFFASGVDILIYLLCPLVGFALMLLLLAGPLRRLGRYTLGDLLEQRLATRRVRLFSGASTVVISLIYLVAQMVGAGALLSILFGLSFNVSVVVVAALGALYVAFGGMLAATWVQLVKAVLLVAAVLFLSALVFAADGPGLYARAAAIHPLGEGLYRGGGLKLDLFSALSLSTGLILGMLGLPHLLVRLLTVPDEAAAKRSLLVATLLIGLVFALILAALGPGAVAHVTGVPAYLGADGKIAGGGNMAIMHLARALGGAALFGVMAAVALATILAVVAGLTVAAATALSHDLLRSSSEAGELRAFRLAAVAVCAASAGIGILFQKENVAFLASLAFAVAASTNFPILLLAIYWRGLTTAGALIGGAVGLAASVGLIVLGPAVWVKVLHNATPVFPWDYPALITAPLAFAVAVAASLASRPAVAAVGKLEA